MLRTLNNFIIRALPIPIGIGAVSFSCSNSDPCNDSKTPIQSFVKPSLYSIDPTVSSVSANVCSLDSKTCSLDSKTCSINSNTCSFDSKTCSINNNNNDTHNPLQPFYESPFVLAAAMVTAQTTSCQPIYNFKISAQSGLALTRINQFHTLFRGVLGNLGPKLPYYLAMTYAQDFLSDYPSFQRTVVTALIATPCIQAAEVASTHRNMTQTSIFRAIQSNPRMLTNGLPFLLQREIIFCACLWSAEDLNISPDFMKNTPFQSLFYGALAGFLTAIPDQQATQLRIFPKTTLKDLFKDFKVLPKGIFFRVSYVTWAMFVLDSVKNHFKTKQLEFNH